MKLVNHAALLVALAFCAGCSSDSVPKASSSDECAACHLSDFRGAPKHVGQKPTKCAVCHTNYAWHPTRTDHPFFALDGAHAKASCFDCHKGNPPVFAGTPKPCVGCHRADYDRSRIPGQPSFPLTCETCHSVTAWKPPLPTFVPHEENAAPAATTEKKKKSIPSPPEPHRRGAAVTPPAPTYTLPAPTYTPPVPTYTPPAPTYTPPAPTPASNAHKRPDTVSGASRHK